MNIFVLDENPVLAAQQQCDKHVVKMIVESAQMLSTAHRMLDGVVERRPSKSGKTTVNYYKLEDEREDILYKAVHFNHPCSIWTRECCVNYNWHYLHFKALCVEYEHRYGKEHSTYTKLGEQLKEKPHMIPHLDHMTPFRLAMQSNPECIALGDPVEAYRAFYQTKQKRFKMEWTNRQRPEWFHAI